MSVHTPDAYYYYLQAHPELDPESVYREYDFEGFRVYRSLLGGFKDAELIAEFSLSNNNVVFSYTDQNLTNGINYYYAVTAFDLNHLKDVARDTVFSREGLLRFLPENSAMPGARTETYCSVPGDVVADNTVDLSDLARIVAYILGQVQLEGQALVCADLNGDQQVDVLDVMLVLDKILGTRTSLAAATYAQTDLTLIDTKRLVQDLTLLGSDESLVDDILKLLVAGGGRPVLPKVFALDQNFPNPFNPSTTVCFSIPEGRTVRVSLRVYDIRGRLVRTLVEGEREAGVHRVFWDGTGDNGRTVSSGVYLYRIRAGEYLKTRKMVLLR